MENVRIGNIPLNNFILILFPVFELAPHILRIDAKLPRCLHQADASSPRARSRLDYPQRFPLIGLVEESEELMKAKNERKQSVVNSLIINNEILWSVSVEVGEGLEDERVVEMLSRVQGH